LGFAASAANAMSRSLQAIQSMFTESQNVFKGADEFVEFNWATNALKWWLPPNRAATA
jgi:hypothetical protein